MGKHSFRINGHDYEVEVSSVVGNVAEVTVNGTEYKVELGTAGPAAAKTAASGQALSGQAVAAPAVSAASAPAAAPVQQRPSGASAGKTVKAPLPGVILDIRVGVGDSVRAGQTVAVLEAMKMENEIEATADGTVTAVNAAKGDSVPEGAAIVTIG